MKDPTAAKRKQAERERRKAEGYTVFQAWVKPSWIPKIKKLIESLKAYPEKKERR